MIQLNDEHKRLVTIMGIITASVLFFPFEGGPSLGNVLALAYCGSLLYIHLWYNKNPANNEITDWFNTDIRDAARYRYMRDHQTWHSCGGNADFGDGLGEVDDRYALVGSKFPYDLSFVSKPMLDHHIDTMMEREKNETS